MTSELKQVKPSIAGPGSHRAGIGRVAIGQHVIDEHGNERIVTAVYDAGLVTTVDLEKETAQ